MAGQSLLAAAAICSQQHANVRTLAGIRPVSLFLLTIAESGDGKSTADEVAQSAIRDVQRKDADEYRQKLAAETPRQKGEPAPIPPRRPYRISRDGTPEGIRRDFSEGVPSQGSFTSEAAAILAGYGMTPENRTRSAAVFNGLWDDGCLSVSRSTSGRIELYDRRFSVHWLLQPDAVRGVLHDSLLSNVGFWPRFLIAWPEPLKPRKAIEFKPEDNPAIKTFWDRCRCLLKPLGDDCRDLLVLRADEQADRLFRGYFEGMEVAARAPKKKGLDDVDLSAVRAFAVRSTEQAFRIAGVLATFAGKGSIDTEAARSAITIAGYSLEIWNRIFGVRQDLEQHVHALKLFEWMLGQSDKSAKESAILQIGPRALRSKDRRDAALAVLHQVGLVTRYQDIWAVKP